MKERKEREEMSSIKQNKTKQNKNEAKNTTQFALQCPRFNNRDEESNDGSVVHKSREKNNRN